MSRVLEQGDVFFFYRPRVGTPEVRGLADVQRFFLVLAPDDVQRYRRIVLGRKRLPDPDAHERVWGFVAEVARSPDEVRDDLDRKVSETRTRGIRVQPGARPVGEGRYALVEHEGTHTHLAHVLELPREPGRAQEIFGIHREGSFIVAVKNPEAPTPAGVGLPPRRRAELPPELLERFRGRRFIPVDPPALLDHERMELVLIGAAQDVRRELGIELDAEAEDLASAELFRRLRVRPGELPVQPLEQGELR